MGTLFWGLSGSLINCDKYCVCVCWRVDLLLGTIWFMMLPNGKCMVVYYSSESWMLVHTGNILNIWTWVMWHPLSLEKLGRGQAQFRKYWANKTIRKMHLELQKNHTSVKYDHEMQLPSCHVWLLCMIIMLQLKMDWLDWIQFTQNEKRIFKTVFNKQIFFFLQIWIWFTLLILTIALFIFVCVCFYQDQV